MLLTSVEIKQLHSAEHPAPHRVLGLHAEPISGYLTITALLPELAQASNAHGEKAKTSVAILDAVTKKVLGELKAADDQGLYFLRLRRKKPFHYQLQLARGNNTQIIDDPYRFSPTLSEVDLHLLHEGNHQNPNKCLGAHSLCHQGVNGIAFTVWAPNATSVSLVGDFNEWRKQSHGMTNLEHYGNRSGYWHIFVPQAVAGQCYKYHINNKAANSQTLKADPYGEQAQYRPETASIITAKKAYPWQDQPWLNSRENKNNRNQPISIYEVHLGSWRRTSNNGFLNYRNIADQLIPYVKSMAFTHIQLMPVSEYPYDGSWGYQPVGLFAPSARFGSPEDFKYFVDCCHQANLGLLIDWVPAHFPSDAHGLAKFDGTHVFEHADPRQGFHPDWNTLIYNYGRNEVANFLRASALHWLEEFHVDGIRVDAVASMLYLDYSRAPDAWIPNKHGGRENLEAVAFLQRFNCELYQRFPGTFSVAEESTSWPGVSKPVNEGGLGFGYKWNMGWMNDTLQYIQRDPIHRKHHHKEMSFGLVYAFDENFVLPISHDEVVHGKGSMIEKMPGDAWQQFANLRAYYAFMWAHPGKKLLFMGCEFAQGREWNFDSELDWQQLDIHWHHGVQSLVKDLNTLYQQTPALYQLDCQQQGFEWLDHENEQESLYSFIRYSNNQQEAVIVVCNFTPKTHHNYQCGVPKAGTYKEILNTDNENYSGSGVRNPLTIDSSAQTWQEQPYSIHVSIPPLSTVMFALKSGVNS